METAYAGATGGRCSSWSGVTIVPGFALDTLLGEPSPEPRRTVKSAFQGNDDAFTQGGIPLSTFQLVDQSGYVIAEIISQRVKVPVAQALSSKMNHIQN